MSKEKAANLIEQHVEKGVLAVCVLLLLYVVLNWVVSSPRQLKVTTGQGRSVEVPPDKADAALLEAARFADKWNRDANASDPNMGDYPQKARDLQLARNVDVGLAIEGGYPRRAIEIDANLGSPVKRKVSLAAIMEAVPPPRRAVAAARPELARTDQPADEIVCHPVLRYPWADLQDAWRDKLRGTSAGGAGVRVVVYGVEGEVQEKLPDGAWSAGRPVTLPGRDGKPLPKPALLDRDGKVIIRPDLPVYDPAKGNAEEVRKFIIDFADKYQEAVLEPGFYPIWDPQTRQWRPWQSSLPRAILSDGPEAEAPPAPGGAGAKVQPLAPIVVPPLRNQQEAGKVLVWLHDTGLQPLKVYRYRIRLILINPLLTYPEDANDPKDAAKPFIETQWSQWSAEVSVPRATEFFVVGGGTGKATMEVFAYSLGQRVKGKFSVAPGQLIGGWRDVKVTNPADGKPVVRPVDFSTGAVMVESDEKRVQRAIVARDTVEILYLDDKGELRRRNGVDDMESLEYKRYEKEVTSVAMEPVTGRPPG